MRVKFLRLEERGERVLSFAPTAMSDDYIRLAAPRYPEMQYCYSPVYDLAAKDNPLFGSGLMSTPRTKRTHYLRAKKQPHDDISKQKKSPSAGLATTEDDDDFDSEFRQLQLQHASLPKVPAVAPRLSSKPLDDTSILSQGTQSEPPGDASLQPSMESNIDPSPRSSLDVIDTTTQESSIPYLNDAARSIYSPPNGTATVPPPPLPKLGQAIQPRRPSFTSSHAQTSTKPLPDATWFPMKPAYRVTHGKSALSAMIKAKASKAENPYASYSHASGKGSNKPMTLCVYLPHTKTPFKPIQLVVRPDAIIDDVIGYILYDYVEQNRKPDLEPELIDLAEWVLLIAEDDGEIEDDLPALDRTRRINQVSFDQFALCRANASQAKQNEQIRAKMGRFKPDLDAVKKAAGSQLALPPVLMADDERAISPQPEQSLLQQQQQLMQQEQLQYHLQSQDQPLLTATTAPHSHTSSNAELSDTAGTHNNSTMLLDATSNGTQNSLMHTPTTPLLPSTATEADSSMIAVPVPSSKAMLTKAALPMTPIKYFRIRLMTSEEVAATTTIPIYAEMFVGDVLELVSRKRKLDPNEYILTLPDSNMVVSNDTTVESLKNVDELTLTKKTTALAAPSSSSNPLWRSPIKKKKDDNAHPMYFASDEIDKQPSDTFLQQYKKYNVNRKTPMFVGKRVSTLVIDGNYIHLMPPEHKGMFDSVKTTSFHVNAVRSCKQSKKAPSNFKIGVMKERDYKTYDLEAETPKEAYEICARIRFLIQLNRGSRN
ncbi:stress-activated map kinase interacting protein 1-domain-containing protein [Gongronella butleri]|nr:stress-activated map kinase interacting protein 1-domain-containing protein [Gongronella butleri]